MECEFCHSNFTTKYVMKNHQKRAKYCLQLQSDHGTEIVSELYKCESCSLEMAIENKSRHLSTCKEKYKNIIKKQEKIIIEYEKMLAIQTKEIQELNKQVAIYKELSERELSCIEEIAKQPRNQTTNTQNNLFNLTPFDINKESFAETIQNSFTKNYLINGQKGVAKFAFDNLLKDKDGKLQYICTDPSRQIYRFKTPDGSLERDVKAKKLTSALTERLIQKSHAIATAEITEGDADVFVLYTTNFQDIKDLVDDNGEFRAELASLTTV